MRPTFPLPCRPAHALLVLATMLAGASSHAADPSAASDARQRHHDERAACASSPAGSDRQACLRDADAAFAQVRRGLPEADAAALAHNASRRCAPLPDADRHDCMARMHGQGTTRGSVAGGGIYRELVTTVPAAPAAAASGAMPAR